jgi:hypothetical protein
VGKFPGGSGGVQAEAANACGQSGDLDARHVNLNSRMFLCMSALLL